MKRTLAVLLALGTTWVAASAQTLPPVTAGPLAPVAPVAPVAPTPVPTPAPTAAPTPAPAPVWDPRPVAVLAVLDKVAQHAATLSIPVGQTLDFGEIAITVRRCLVRPPALAPDAAAWLKIVPHPAKPGAAAQFRGWMLASAPSVSGLASPLYDIRVVGCR